MNLFRFVVVAGYVTLCILSSSSVVMIVDSSNTSTHGGTPMLMMVESYTFQILSPEQPNLCIEVFKTLHQVGRLWLRPCKPKGDNGIERQMFGITTEGKLYLSTKPSSCIFLYNKKLKYRINCTGKLHKEKNRFMLNFFDNAIFLMGDVTKVIAVRELHDKQEIKLQKQSFSKITKQHWTIHLDSDRLLQQNIKILEYGCWFGFLGFVASYPMFCQFKQYYCTWYCMNFHNTKCHELSNPSSSPSLSNHSSNPSSSPLSNPSSNPSSSYLKIFGSFTTYDELFGLVREYCDNETGWKDHSNFLRYG